MHIVISFLGLFDSINSDNHICAQTHTSCPLVQVSKLLSTNILTNMKYQILITQCQLPCHCSLTLHFQGEVETHDLSTYAAPAILSYYTIYEASSSCLHEEILPINLHSLLLFHVTFPYTQERSFSSSRLYLQCFQIHH